MIDKHKKPKVRMSYNQLLGGANLFNLLSGKPASLKRNLIICDRTWEDLIEKYAGRLYKN